MEQHENGATKRTPVPSLPMGTMTTPAENSAFEPSRTVRLMILVGLTLQTSLFVLVRRYSQAVLHERYEKATVLMVAEAIKLVFSAVAISLGWEKKRPVESPSVRYRQVEFTDEEMHRVKGEISADRTDRTSETSSNNDDGHAGQESNLSYFWHLIATSPPMALQAVIYLVSNMVAYMALEYIDGGLYSVLMQGKILSTAVFAVIIMGKQLNRQQWRSLLMLLLAVVLISKSGGSEDCTAPGAAADTSSSAAGEKEHLFHRYMIGLMYTFFNVALSGFSTVFMERTFKDSAKGLSIWERNFQLALCSIGAYCVLLFVRTGIDFFHGFTFVASLCALCAASGGILVALSLKYTDSIMKSLASTFSIVLICFFEWAFMEGSMTDVMAIGSVLVIMSVQFYNQPVA